MHFHMQEQGSVCLHVHLVLGQQIPFELQLSKEGLRGILKVIYLLIL